MLKTQYCIEGECCLKIGTLHEVVAILKKSEIYKNREVEEAKYGS